MKSSPIAVWLSRFRIVYVNHKRALDLLVLGGLALVSLCFYCHVAETYLPVMDLAVGPDQDDWWGIFSAVEKGWPYKWDTEWAMRMPLVPLLVSPVARAFDIPMALASQLLTILLGSLVPGLTWMLGRHVLGRPAALAASVWIIGQPNQASMTVLTTAYSYVTPFYLLLVLGIVGTFRKQRGSLALVFGASLLLTALLLQGILIVLYTIGAAAAVALLLPRKARSGIRQLARLILPGVTGIGLSLQLMASLFPHLESPLQSTYQRILMDIMYDPALHDLAMAMDILPPVNPVPGPGHVPQPEMGITTMGQLQGNLEVYFMIPYWLSLAGLALGLAFLVASRSRPHGFARLLMVTCLLPFAYGVIAGNRPEHWFHWFPVVGLIMVAGLVWPLGRLPRLGQPAQWLVSIALIVWWTNDIYEMVDMTEEDPADFYILKNSYAEKERNAKLCRQSFASISQGGALFTDSPQLHGLRGALKGPKVGQVVDISYIHHPPAPAPLDLRRFERPWFLATDRPPQELAKAFSSIPSFSSKPVRLDGGMQVGQSRFILYLYKMDLGGVLPKRLHP